jgi:hypothetical protein
MLARAPLAASLIALAACAPVADAKLPPKGGKLIVPGRSIGGVKIGMKAEDAVKKWGKGGSCDEVIGVSCRYDGTAKQGSARFDLRDGKVSGIVLECGQKASGECVYKGPITKWKTKKKIGIGSSLRRVLKAYPKATPDGGGVELATGKRVTFFSSSGGRTARIEIVPASQL